MKKGSEGGVLLGQTCAVQPLTLLWPQNHLVNEQHRPGAPHGDRAGLRPGWDGSPQVGLAQQDPWLGRAGLWVLETGPAAALLEQRLTALGAAITPLGKDTQGL